MNRIASFLSSTPTHNANPLSRPSRRLREETEAMMQDLAYVLKLTQQVKSAILDEQEPNDSVAV